VGNKRLSNTNFKLQVVQYADKHSNKPAGLKFDVNERYVRKWRKKKERVENVAKNKWEFCGKRSTFPQFEEELCAYAVDLRKSQCMVLLKFCSLKLLK
jgi:hypothetical protein